jgi:hypothetical protein
MSDTERIEKQVEGTNLALAAVAEVLQKMDARLAKEEREFVAKTEAQQSEVARADLVKSIATEVLSIIKQESDQGLDVSGEDRKAKATGGTPQNADDSESPVDQDTKIEDQQNTIQASSLKKDNNGNNGEDKEEEEDSEKAYKGSGMAKNKNDDDEADEEAANLPEVEKKGDNDDEEEDPDDMKAMKKQIADMKKQLEAAETGMQKSIQVESENRLRKMGFREENGLQAPKVTKGLGVDSTPLIKSDGGDVAGQLVNLSYSELRKLQHQIDTGNTDGVPKELLT